MIAELTPSRGRYWLWVAALAGLILRLGLLAYTADLDARIADEKRYVQLATSLVEGRGFAWSSGEPTSLRPPLYPALVAAIWSVAGAGNLQAVRFLQFLLALGTAALTYAVGRRAFDRRTGAIAGAIVWLYPSLLFLNYNILGETLFTCLLMGFVLLAIKVVERPGGATAVACGAVLGLGALTRSVLWPVPIVFCPLVAALAGGGARRRLAAAALVFVGYAAVVGPWAVRNTRLQQVVTIVDTMGGMNLRMGNYEHTPEDRMWDAVSLSGEKSWVHELTLEQAASPAGPGAPITEGMKDKWAQRKAIQYMTAHPGTTLRRAAIKFGDFWGLEREFAAAVGQGLYAPPAWFSVLAVVLILASYGLLAMAATAGIWLTPPAWRVHVLLLLPVAVVAGVHTIVFGHSRYHLPLVPILALYAASALVRPSAWLAASGAARIGAAASAALLLVIWLRQLLVVEAGRLSTWVQAWW